MKISNSKKELARIISENGGWRDGYYAIQDKDDAMIWFADAVPQRDKGNNYWNGEKFSSIRSNHIINSWHQCSLSRDEYFMLHPKVDDRGWFTFTGKRMQPVADKDYIQVEFECGSVIRGNGDEFDWRGENIIAYRILKTEHQVRMEKLSK